jgi:predicted transcriptional regulator of viral defense system
MGGYLSANELAELLEVKPNQYCRMVALLTKRRWKFEIASNGMPKVARAYHDRKMGISEEKTSAKYADTPNLKAFA